MLGFSGGIYLPSVIPLITGYYTVKHWGKAIAIHDIGGSVAIFATPLIVLFLLHVLPWRGIFIVYACVLIVCSIIFFLLTSELKVSNPPKTLFKNIVTIKSLWLIATVWALAAGANFGVYSITPLYLTKELQLSIEFSNTILGISRLASIGVSVICGFFVDRFKLKKIMFLVLVIAGFLTIILGLAPVRSIGIVLFLQASIVTGFFPVSIVGIARIFGKEMTGLATGIILSIGFFIGGGIIPYLLGVSGDLYSFRSGITILGLFTTLASILVLRLRELE